MSNLVSDKLYYLEFFTNKMDYYNKANNNIGLLLSDTDIVRNSREALNIPPTLLPYGNPVITDSVNWTKVSGVYRAHGGEQYVLLGNFLPDSLTTVVQVHPGGYEQATYSFDDVSVIPLDSLVLKADAGRDTTIYKGDSAWIGSRISGITDMHWRTSAGGVVADSVPGLWVKPTTTTTYILD